MHSYNSIIKGVTGVQIKKKEKNTLEVKKFSAHSRLTHVKPCRMVLLLIVPLSARGSASLGVALSLSASVISIDKIEHITVLGSHLCSISFSNTHIS